VVRGCPRRDVEAGGRKPPRQTMPGLSGEWKYGKNTDAILTLVLVTLRSGGTAYRLGPPITGWAANSCIYGGTPRKGKQARNPAAHLTRSSEISPALPDAHCKPKSGAGIRAGLTSQVSNQWRLSVANVERRPPDWQAPHQRWDVRRLAQGVRTCAGGWCKAPGRVAKIPGSLLRRVPGLSFHESRCRKPNGAKAPMGDGLTL